VPSRQLRNNVKPDVVSCVFVSLTWIPKAYDQFPLLRVSHENLDVADRLLITQQLD